MAIFKLKKICPNPKTFKLFLKIKLNSCFLYGLYHILNIELKIHDIYLHLNYNLYLVIY